MKYLFITATRLPHPTGNGVSVLNDGLVECFARLGWEPVVVPVALRYGAEEEKKHRAHLEARGIEVVDLPGITRPDRRLADRVRRLVHRRDDELLPSSRDARARLARLVRDRGMGAVVAAGWQSLGLAAGVGDVYRVASVVDLINPAIKLRRQVQQWKAPVTRLRRSIARRNLQRMEALAMRHARGFDLVIEHAHQHAETLRQMGLANVLYVPHPIRDPGRPEHDAPSDPATILVAGSLKGAASLKGFEFLLDQILPALDRRRAELTRAVRVRIVGHGDLPPLLRERLVAHPLVDLVGYVDRIDVEYRRCDALLVAIPVEHGFRTRIAEALSLGTCVVAHAANQAGMPELTSGRNILSDTTGDGIAAHLVRVVNDPAAAREIAERGYATFVREYSRERAVERLRTALPARLVAA
ncbi:MAG TPA: glycosyltransferase family 4 protein [Kofleriaceae bacterium]|nr:glycosyltransferase family 4 protein [Kofleriaceae bacterium]